jgi:hypothetical protein
MLISHFGPMILPASLTDSRHLNGTVFALRRCRHGPWVAEATVVQGRYENEALLEDQSSGGSNTLLEMWSIMYRYIIS